jgi:hypothetical protein
MHKQTLWLLVLMLGVISLGTSLAAQQSTAPPDQQSPQQAQPPAPTPDASTQPAPEPQAQSQQDQIFKGTIVKAGDKWVLQAASGKSFDLDNQNLAKQYEGKPVRVQGTLDQDGKTIHMK